MKDLAVVPLTSQDDEVSESSSESESEEAEEEEEEGKVVEDREKGNETGDMKEGLTTFPLRLPNRRTRKRHGHAGIEELPSK